LFYRFILSQEITGLIHTLSHHSSLIISLIPAMKRVSLRSIQFQGANGFPIALYRPIFTRIRSKILTILDKKGYEVKNASSFTIGGCDLFQHVHSGPDWTAMVEELTSQVEKRSAEKGSVICIGHSFGTLS
jgi:hypothetical protein